MLTRNQFLTYCSRNNLTCVFQSTVYNGANGVLGRQAGLVFDTNYGQEYDYVGTCYEYLIEHLRLDEYLDEYENNPTSVALDPESLVRKHMRSKCEPLATFDWYSELPF